MSVQNTEILWRKSHTMQGGFEIGGGADPSANAANGGVMLATEAVHAAKNAIWPDAPQSELTNGSIAFRKAFIHIANALDQSRIETDGADYSIIQPRVFVETSTPGDDSIAIFLGTQSDTQSSLTGSEDLYGSATLDVDASATDTSIVVLVEDDEDGNPLVLFRTGNTVRISNKTTVDAIGDEEYVVLTGVSGFTGNQVTLTFSGDPLENNYLASNTRVASCLTPSTLVSTVDNISAPSGSGTFNDLIYVNNLGCVEDTWTVEFDSATAYHITGTRTGLLSGAPTISGEYAPANTSFGSNPPFFVIKGSGNWGGTWADGDTFTFQTHPASVPLWYRRMIQAGSASLTPNNVIVGITGQST